MSKSPYDLSTLIAWLETKDPNAIYDCSDKEGCLFFQYFTAMGCPVISCGAAYWRESYEPNITHPFPDGWADISMSNQTFGGALADFRELQG